MDVSPVMVCVDTTTVRNVCCCFINPEGPPDRTGRDVIIVATIIEIYYNPEGVTLLHLYHPFGILILFFLFFYNHTSLSGLNYCCFS